MFYRIKALLWALNLNRPSLLNALVTTSIKNERIRQIAAENLFI